MKCVNLNFLEPSGPLQAYNETALPLIATGGNVLGVLKAAYFYDRV